MDPQTFQNKDEQWVQMCSNANAIIDYCGLQAPDVRHATCSRVGRAQAQMISVGWCYIPICAAVHEELARRFLKQEHNDIYQSISALSSASKMFLDSAKIVAFAKRFGSIRTEVDAEVIRTEVSVVSRVSQKNRIVGKFMGDRLRSFYAS